MAVGSTSQQDPEAPFLPENLWGYGKRLRFVDGAIQRESHGKPRREVTVLDIGGGNGSQLAMPLAEGGYQVTAIDPHGPSIQRGRMLAPAVKFHHGCLRDLPFSRFDCVIIAEVLEHLDAPEILLKTALSYLAEHGVLIITVPNGYGEFELDRRSYRALHMDRLVAWLRSMFNRGQSIARVSGSEDTSPHLQRFTRSVLYAMFRRNHLQVVEVRGTSVASGPFVAHLFGKSPLFIRANAAAADILPLPWVAGWMFCLKLAHR